MPPYYNLPYSSFPKDHPFLCDHFMQLCCTGSKSIPARYRTCTKNSPLREKSGFGKTDLTLAALSYELAISERQLFRRIKSITGLTPNKYIRAIKLQIVREAIESGRYRTIAEVSYAAGFDTPAYFGKLFKEHYGRDVNELL